MVIKSVTDAAFRKYGRVISEIDFSELVAKMDETPLPDDVAYEPSVEILENLAIKEKLQTVCFGELPIQVGYCNGHNHLLNAVEYHRSSEINVAATDAIFLLGLQQDITDDFTYDTAKIEAFQCPKGTAVEFYATTLHYAPCSVGDNGFKVSVVLPKDTNLPLDEKHAGCEDALITAKNKWLIGHAEGGLEPGTHIGLIGENISV
ncbi:MAG: DUF4867 family protein [Lachnospiraceae bacterium]|mgnify:CR=1 FL=1|nr:DUF4867 family protein [Lachnospiraceae bacterium]